MKYTHLFNEFLAGDDTLQVYEDSKLVFNSNKDRLLPLMEYLAAFRPYRPVTIFDKVTGNAAALLSVKANCREIYSPLGSQIAINTLEKYDIKYRINKIIPFIQRPDGTDMCPMEKLSIDKDPEEFYEALRHSHSGP
jgi:hypothetical protein